MEDGDKSLGLDSSFRYAYPHRYFDGIPFSGCPIKTLYLGRNIESRDEQNNLITHFMSWFLSEVTSAVIGKNVTLSHKNCMNFWGCDKLIDIVVNSGVTNICNQAFEGCSGLTTITIPNSVTNIGDYAFKGCSGLTTIAIPNSVTNIGNYAFQYCSSLTTIAIPNSVTNIGNYAFQFCSSLTNLTLGNSVENIGNSAFSGCLLDSIYMLGKIPPLVDSSNFSNSQYMKSKLYVPKGSLSAYQEAEIWKNFWNIEEKDVTNIESIENLTTHNLLTFEQVENGIKLKNLTNDRILIYTDEGKLIKNILKYNGETINLDKGIYIIYSKKHSCKILVK